MLKLRHVLLVFVLLGFAFLLTQQRIETKNHDLKIRTLQREIIALESSKRDMILKIQKEKKRLNLMPLEKVGVPISLYDVVSVPVAAERPAKKTSDTPVPNHSERVFLALVSLFSHSHL